MVVVKRWRRYLATQCRRLADWLHPQHVLPAVGREVNDEAALTEADYQMLAADFEAHATAVRAEVSRYADLLAGDDPVLRQRLRQFESGATP